MEYTYNKNGSMRKDLNKGISVIEYNSLNLPRQMDIKSPVAEARNEYTYSAGGQKLKVVQKWNPNYSTAPVVGSDITVSTLTQTKTTDYIGNKIYENGTLKRVLVDGGYIEGNVYYFYQNDHLGNNRVVANASGVVTQRNHYYPFGTAFAEGTKAEQGKQPYKYNGKELDQMHGLNLYDYFARHYESAIGRFISGDPLAEKYYSITPYVYCYNNPLRFVDPDGLAPGDPLLNRYQRKEYGGSGLRNVGVALHNTAAAIFNVPINIVNDVADESQFIYNNGVGTYLSSVADNWITKFSNQVDYWANTPISQQLRDERKASTTPEALENAAAGTILMATPIKSLGNSSKGLSVSIESVTNVSTKGGALRASLYGEGWAGKSLKDAVDRFTSGSEAITTSTGKILYKNNSTGIQVVYDKNGNYFRIQNTNVTGKRQYLDIDGNIPNNIKENGRIRGRSTAEYNQVTHFNNID